MALKKLNDSFKIGVFIILMVLCGAVFSSIGLFFAAMYYGFPLASPEFLATLLLQKQGAQIIIQIFSSFGIFVVSTLVFAHFFEQKPFSFLKMNRKPRLDILVYTIILFLLANFVLDLLVRFTHLIPFEQSNNPIIVQLLNMEKQAELAYNSFLNFSSFTYFVAVFFTMAIIPALGEEMSFRGVFFTLFQRSTANTALAIGFSAFLFAIIHFQLHNFLAIFFMGALLAYIYAITQNIWYAVLAHLFNNGMIVLLSYLNKLNWIQYDFTETEQMPIYMAIFGALIFIVSFYFYSKIISKKIEYINE